MSLASSLLLAMLIVGPGFVLTQGLARSSGETWMTALLRGIVVSVGMLVVGSLILLRVGAFSLFSVTVLVSLPAGGILLCRRAHLWKAVGQIRLDRREMLHAGVIVGLVGMLVGLTAHWNFLAAGGMDGGNYEAYAAWWSTTGHLYVPVSPLVDAGVEREWLQGANAWVLRQGWDAARPNYFYGYPTLLALVRSASGNLGSSWVPSGVAAATGLIAAYVLGVRLARRRLVAWATAVLILLTPVFMFYAKQIMSESLATLGVLAVVLGILGMDDERRPDAWMLSAGLVLALTSKIDAALPVLALVGMGAIVAWFGSWPARRPARSWGMAGMAATLLSAWLVVDMVDPGYLGKSTLGDRLPILASLPGAHTPLFTWLLVGMAAGWLLIPVLARRRPDQWPARLDGESLPVRDRAAVWVVAVGWLAYLGWNVAVRPESGDIQTNIDALNLVRLDDVFSVGLLAVIGLFPLAAAITGRGRRDTLLLAIPFLLVLGYLIFESNHSRAELWWMRRYLVVLVPTTMIAVAGLTQSMAGLVRRRARTVAVVAILAAGTLGVSHVRSILPVLQYRQNAGAPAHVQSLADLVSDADLVAVVGTSRIVRGLGVTLGSVEGAPVLPRMTPQTVTDAMEQLDEQQLYVLSDTPLDIAGLELLREGTYTNQWAGWMFVLDRSPTSYARHDKYWLYVRPDVGG